MEARHSIQRKGDKCTEVHVKGKANRPTWPDRVQQKSVRCPHCLLWVLNCLSVCFSLPLTGRDRFTANGESLKALGWGAKSGLVHEKQSTGGRDWGCSKNCKTTKSKMNYDSLTLSCSLWNNKGWEMT